MPSANSEQVARIAKSAQLLDVADRNAYLVRECGDDESLLAAVRETMFGSETLRIDIDETDAGRRIDPPKDLLERTTVDFADPDKLVGQTLDGRFRIEKNLTDKGGDTGGIGVVYLAKDVKLMNKEVVVKILNENALKHPDIVRKFEHEKEALIRLDHPNIVRILDSGNLSDGNPFMAMDFIKGHSLRKAIQMAGKLPLDVTANIIECVGDALSAAHSEKILHRDIKPENIMLTPIDEGQYRVRVIDFGIARVEDSQLAPVTEISRAIGSVHYISPEQLIGRLDLTPAADIYSLAIVAYEMLTGELPFKPKSLAEMYQLEQAGVRTRPGELRGDMPREAERILLNALEFEPEKRPSNARAFARLLAHELKIDSYETDRFYASVKTEFHTSPTQHIALDGASEFKTLPRLNPPPTSLADKLIGAAKWAIPAAFVIALLALTGAYFAWNSGKQQPAIALTEAPTPTPDLGTERTILYYLMVQKIRNGERVGERIKSPGAYSIDSGDKAALSFKPDSDGHMYVFNEGKKANGEIGTFLLFPSPSRNSGISSITAGTVIETSESSAKGKPGTEVIWIIWTKEPNSDLEKICKKEIDGGDGEIKGPERTLLESFLAKERPSKPASEMDAEQTQTTIRARGDEVVYRFELKQH